MSDLKGDNDQLEPELRSKSSVNQNPDLKTLLASALGALIWQSMIAGGLYLLAPGYFLPFFNNQEVRFVLIALLTWQLLGPWVIAKLPDERWKQINRSFFSSAPLSIALIVGPALMTPLVEGDASADKSASDVTTQAADNAGGPDCQAIPLKNAVLKTSTMSIQIDSALLTNTLSHYGLDATASTGATYLVVFHTFGNEGSSPISLRPGSPYSPGLIVGTDDGTSFSPDEDASDAMRDEKGFLRELQLQPGLAKKAVVVFEIPLTQLKKSPCFFISRSTWAGKIPLFPDQSIEAPKSTAASLQEVPATSRAPKLSEDETTTTSKMERQSEANQQNQSGSSALDKDIAANGDYNQSPAAVMKHLYEIHLHSHEKVFDPDSRTNLDKYFDQQLADLIWKNIKQEIFDLDPLTNAQNLDSPDFKIGETEINQKNATVYVNFINLGKVEAMKFYLRNTGGAWRITNIDYANGSNLLQSME